MNLRNGRPLFTNDTKFVDFTKFRVKKINRTTHVFLGEATSFVDFGNDYTIAAVAYQLQGNQYRKMAYGVQPTKYCDFFKNDKFFYDDLLKVSDLPAKGVCPWPKGTYTIRGSVITFRNIPQIFEGDYMLEGVIRKGNVVVNGYQMYVNIEIEAASDINLRDGKPLFTNDTTFADMTRLRIKKIDRKTHVFIGNATSFVDIGNDYTIEVVGYQKQGNQYRKMAYGIKPTKYCDFFNNDKFFYDDLLKVSDLPAKGVCPWPKGNYEIRGAFFEYGNFPPYFEGDYMLEGVIRKEANCYKKQGNEYRKTPYNFQKVKFCDFFVHEKFFYDELLKVSNLPAKGVCPWPKGDYYVTGNNFQMSAGGPYIEINLTEGRPLFKNDTKFSDYTKLRVKKINRTTHVFLGEATSFVDIGNDYTIEANTYQKQGNEYRKMPYGVQATKYCDFFNNDKFFYDDLLKVSDLPAKRVCPWPQGTYTIRGSVITFQNVPKFFNGDYMAEGIIRKGDDVVNGYQMYISVVNIS
ncbi:unnamed protein product [Diamesa hyperborea]